MFCFNHASAFYTSMKMLMNNNFKAQTPTGNPTGNYRCQLLASRALNMSCYFSQSARSIESRCVVKCTQVFLVCGWVSRGESKFIDTHYSFWQLTVTAKHCLCESLWASMISNMLSLIYLKRNSFGWRGVVKNRCLSTHRPPGVWMKCLIIDFKLILVKSGWDIACEIAIRWMSLNLTDRKTLAITWLYIMEYIWEKYLDHIL